MAINHEMPDYPAQLVVIKSFVTKPLELTSLISPTFLVNTSSPFPSSASRIPHSRHPTSSTLASYDAAYASYDDEEMDDDDEEEDDTQSVFSDCGSVHSSVSSEAPEDELEPFQVIDTTSFGYAVPVMVYASLEQAVRLSTQRVEAERRRQEALINEVHNVTYRSPSLPQQQQQQQQQQQSPAPAVSTSDWNSPGAANTYADVDEDEDAFFSMG